MMETRGGGACLTPGAGVSRSATAIFGFGFRPRVLCRHRRGVIDQAAIPLPGAHDPPAVPDAQLRQRKDRLGEAEVEDGSNQPGVAASQADLAGELVSNLDRGRYDAPQPREAPC